MTAPAEQTQPSRPARPMHQLQPVRVPAMYVRPRRPFRPRWWMFVLAALLAAYFFTPGRSNVLILGTDDSPERGALGRTDTIMLATVDPWAGYVGLLGIPRDLWVTVPGVGEQRINTAYFFAEAAQPGAGPEAAMDTVRQNFGVTVNHYALIRMDGVVQVVDAMDGVTVTLDEPIGGLPAGRHTLDGKAALAFARERYGADDFSRMQQGQVILRALFLKALNPLAWPRLPLVWVAAAQSVQTDVPAWLYPRLGLALLRAGPGGMDTRSITREMVIPFQTSGGAQVLGPNWDAINPVLLEMFGE